MSLPIISQTTLAIDAITAAWTPGPVFMAESDTLEVVSVGPVSYGTPGETYSFPEGTYSPGTDPAHADDPGSVLPYSGFEGGAAAFTVGDTAPMSLACLVLPDGQTPNFGANCYSVPQVLVIGRDTTFSPADLAAAGADNPETLYRLWFVFNDETTAFSDNSGSFAVTVTRYGEIAMSLGLTSLLRPQFVQESSWGTNAACTRQWNWLTSDGFKCDPEQKKEQSGQPGYKYATRSELVTESAKVSGKGKFDYEGFGYVEASATCVPVTTTVSTGVYQHVFDSSLFSPDTVQSYTVEAAGAIGGSDRAYKVNGLVWAGYKISTEREKSPDLSVTGYARALQDAITPSTGQNAVFTVTQAGSATGGAFILLFDNQPVSVAYNAAASVVQTAIQALGGIWASATVAGSTGGPYTVTNTGGIPIQLPSVNYAGLTGGTTPTVTVAQTSAGGMKIQTNQLVQAGDLGVSFAASLIGLDNAATAIVNEFKTDIDIAERTTLVYRQNLTDVGPGAIVEKKADDQKHSISLTMAYDSTVSNFISNSKSSTGMYIRLQWIQGGQTPVQFVSGYSRTITMDVYGIPTWKSNTDSAGNIRSVELDIELLIDTTGNFFRRVTIQNDVASYTAT
ncbi:MAG TPA: hypothetical protein VGL56_14855 [Fimbriimonadaceae bacterium]